MGQLDWSSFSADPIRTPQTVREGEAKGRSHLSEWLDSLKMDAQLDYGSCMTAFPHFRPSRGAEELLLIPESKRATEKGKRMLPEDVMLGRPATEIWKMQERVQPRRFERSGCRFLPESSGSRFLPESSGSRFLPERSGMLEVEGEAVVGSSKFSVETEEKEKQERSVKLEIKGEAVVGQGKFPAETEGEEQEKIAMMDVEGQAVLGGDKVSTETEVEEESFAEYRSCWEVLMGEGSSFEDSTLLSSMLFTHCTPGYIPVDAVVGRTFQVYSVKIAEIKGLEWPLMVYGVVAARDEVDKHRNPLFLRSRDDCQILHQEDPFLHLTGPCRAIVSEEPIEIEIQLRINHGKKSDDKALITQVFYSGDYDQGVCSTVIENHLCKIELSYEQFEESVQATIFGVHVAESSPFEYGVRVMCSSIPPGCTDGAVEPRPSQVVLFDSRYRKMSMGKWGYLNLSRQVVSVELEGKLELLIEAYAPSGCIDAHGSVFITPQKCNTSQHTIDVGGSEVKITVAWSLLVQDKTLILMTGYVDPLAYCPPMPSSFTEKLGLPEE